MDGTATISWVIMDTLWLWELPEFALLLSPFIITSIVKSFYKTKSKTVKQLLIVSGLLVLMNLAWIAMDFAQTTGETLLLKVVATCFAICAIILTTLTLKNVR